MRSLKRDLIERRFWPLVVFIIAAAVAVPFVLHGHRANADIAAPPAAKPGSSAPASGTADHHGAAKRPRVTPTSKTRDPFEAADVAAATTTTTTSTTSTTPAASTPSSASSSTSESVSSGSSGASSQTTTPAETTPTTTTAPSTTPVTSSHGSATVKSWDIFTVNVRVGAPGHPVAHAALSRLTPLPSERSPEAMYMGVGDHGQLAAFALGAGVQAHALSGARSRDVVCEPSKTDCAVVGIPAGRSVGLVFRSATGAQRTLVIRVSRIGSRTTQSSSAVKTAQHDVSPVGLCDLKLGDPLGFFNLDDDSVTIPSTAACRHLKLAVAFPGTSGTSSSSSTQK